MDLIRLDHACSRETVREAIEARGIDTSKFMKPFERFWMELRNQDAITTWNEPLNSFINLRYSTKLQVQTPEGYICEIGRKFADHDTPSMKTEGWMVSGTQRRNYVPLHEVRREAKAEIGIAIPENELKQLNVFPEGTLRPSRTYPGFMSVTLIYRFLWKTDRVFRRKVIHDTGVDILLGRFSSIPDEVSAAYLDSQMQYDRHFRYDQDFQDLERILLQAS